ncbi:uncharacterized protein LOC106152002 [Lingula anatina]|uniref:Uncharacterized protein LOC106152002 n=1 Tax=Lingula anatina TaxID=7574 RepID=A0A1S3H4L3_LINAN|nr:uncharacterized protein LOC106152002 [Lingula anatina]|eukprot:XP_013380907.1 uncharacterized protein LOC106152002 [Lingula anatina]
MATSDARPILERRILIITCFITLLAFIFYIVSITTDYWAIIDTPNGVNTSGMFILGAHLGIWRFCYWESNVPTGSLFETDDKLCRYVHLFTSAEDVMKNSEEVDTQTMDMNRSAAAFSIIGLGLILLGHLFAVYSLNQLRFMYKRVTGCIHIMCALCIILINEIMINNVIRRVDELARFADSELVWGYSIYLSWVAFAVFLAAGIVFFLCSKKRKGEHAFSEEEALENEPIHLGRI